MALTKTKKAALIAEIKEVITGWGFSPDRHGTWYPKIREERIKFEAVSLRFEIRLTDGSWMRARSGYYKDLSVSGQRIVGLKKGGCA